MGQTATRQLQAVDAPYSNALDFNAPLNDDARWIQIARFFNGDENWRSELLSTNITAEMVNRIPNSKKVILETYCKVMGNASVVESGGGGDCGFYSIITLQLFFVFLDFIDYGKRIKDAFTFEKETILKIKPAYLVEWAKLRNEERTNYKLRDPSDPDIRPQYDALDTLFKLKSIYDMRLWLHENLPTSPTTGKAYRWTQGEWLTDEGMQKMWNDPESSFQGKKFNWIVVSAGSDDAALHFTTPYPTYTIMSSPFVSSLLVAGEQQEARHSISAIKAQETVDGRGALHIYNSGESHFQPILPVSFQTIEIPIYGDGRAGANKYTQLELFSDWLIAFFGVGESKKSLSVPYDLIMRSATKKGITAIMPNGIRDDIKQIAGLVRNAKFPVGRICDDVRGRISTANIDEAQSLKYYSTGYTLLMQKFIRDAKTIEVLQDYFEAMYEAIERPHIYYWFQQVSGIDLEAAGLAVQPYTEGRYTRTDKLTLKPLGDINLEKLVVLGFLRTLLLASNVSDRDVELVRLVSILQEIRDHYQVQESSIVLS